jgi:hypothetical protein
METEQRMSNRFLAKDNVIAALKNEFTKIGKVRDISAGGLSFEHIYDEILNKESLKKDIFLFVNGYCLPRVPCRVVYDIPVDLSDEYPPTCFIHYKTRRCGVKFEALSEDQKTHLEIFLKTYTKGNAP